MSKKSFKPKAHILRLLGEELIKSPVMAIYELIKNSYDGDAKTVRVDFFEPSDLSRSKISVEDDGIGIDEETLENVWLEPGTAHRKSIDSDGKRTAKKSKFFGRIPMGEKGVGRFAAHKLGDVIKLISRPAVIDISSTGEKIIRPLQYEIVMEIDWRMFSQSQYLDDVEIEWKKVEIESEFYFKHQSGTLIEISTLKEEWTRGMARKLKANTLSMLSPRHDSESFKIDLEFHNKWLLGIKDPSEILSGAPYKFSALLDEEYNLIFDYEFHLSNNQEIGGRKIINSEDYDRNVRGEIRALYREKIDTDELEIDKAEILLADFDKAKLPFGGLLLTIYSFDLDSASLRDYSDNPRQVKQILKEHAGVRVFRKDLRVYDYGEPGNDWLGLDLKRVNNKEWFSNNQSFGYVYLDSDDSSVLVEKTNREGFVENLAFLHFKIVLEFLLTQFKVERHADRGVWLKYNKTSRDSGFKEHLSGLKGAILSTEFKNPASKDLLLKEAEKVEKKYEDDKNTLLIPAGVGMTASVALHEIEKLVPRMQEAISGKNCDCKILRQQIAELEEYTDGILSVLRKSSSADVSLPKSIAIAVKNYALKLKQRKIEIFVENPDNVETITSDNRHIITMLMNIIDNSIYWLDTVYKDGKSILFKLKKENGQVSLLIVDNGPGFRDSPDQIVRPYFSRKSGGIGIGMYLVDTIMLRWGKLNIITSGNVLQSMGVPSRFDGAAVELIFNKNQKK